MTPIPPTDHMRYVRRCYTQFWLLWSKFLLKQDLRELVLFLICLEYRLVSHITWRQNWEELSIFKCIWKPCWVLTWRCSILQPCHRSRLNICHNYFNKTDMKGNATMIRPSKIRVLNSSMIPKKIPRFPSNYLSFWRRLNCLIQFGCVVSW